MRTESYLAVQSIGVCTLFASLCLLKRKAVRSSSSGKKNKKNKKISLDSRDFNRWLRDRKENLSCVLIKGWKKNNDMEL